MKVNELFNSKNGNWLETIESEKPDQYFVITAYEKMKGSFLNKENINTEKTKNLGKTIGKIHKISKKFKPSKNLYKRNDWSNDHILDFEKFYPKSDKKIMIKAYEKLKLIKQIPINKEGYGLIHNDLHNNNYFVNNESILIFDFDDSVYNWYINDLAINIFYSKRVIEKENLNIYLKNLFSGYWQENDLEKSWLNYIPDFIELRDFILYSVINENINRKNPEKSDIEILELIRKRIINGNNLSEVDYSKYVN